MTCGEVGEVADCNRASFDEADDSTAGQGFEAPDRRELHTTVARTRHDRGRERMFADVLEAGRQSQQRALVTAWNGLNRNQRRLAFRQRSGLVHDDRGDLLQDLERFRVRGPAHQVARRVRCRP